MEQLARGDQWLRQERHDLAMVAYQTILRESPAVISSALLYRIGVCQEALGSLDAAAGTYGELSGRGQIPWDCAGLLGLGRVHLSLNQPHDAARVLSRLVLISADPELRGLPLIDEGFMLFGLAAARQSLGCAQPGPLNEQLASPLLRCPPGGQFLEILSRAPESSNDTAPVFPGRVGVGPASDGSSDRTTFSMGPVPVKDLLGLITDRTGLHCTCTSDASQHISPRTIVLNVHEISLPLLLSAVASEQELTWQVEGSELRISCPGETPEDEVRGKSLRAAQAILEQMVETQPRHALAPACLLELGNLAQAGGDLNAAIEHFEQLVRQYPRSELTTHANYNMALCCSRLGDLATSRDLLYRVVDGAPRHPLTPLAYLRVGRIRLYQGEPELAVSCFRRACSQADGPTRGAGAIGLATAYLLTNNPRAAGLSLGENRDVLIRPPYRNLAAFLSSLSRLRAVPNKRDHEHESRLLLASLLSVRDDELLGPVETLLVGQAFRELAMDEEMGSIYDAAFRTDLPEWIALEMSFALTDSLLSSGLMRLGVERLSTVAEESANPRASVARLRLAEIALRESKAEQCIEWCRRALESSESQTTRSALRLMGRAYEQAGKHAQAASCYAGQVPD